MKLSNWKFDRINRMERRVTVRKKIHRMVVEIFRKNILSILFISFN